MANLNQRRQQRLIPWQFAVVPMLLFLFSFPLGCGGTSDSPAGGTSTNSLLSPQQLKAWIDNGYKDEKGNKVVIFDGSSAPNYTAGHIEGAFSVSYATDFCKTRSDGPIDVALMAPDGAQMDALVQKYGIDASSVVVFTGDSVIWPARGYWTFRYWGFPQNHLFVLDGKATTANSVWTAAGYALSTVTPALPTASTFGVHGSTANIDRVRAPLSEMMSVASGGMSNGVIIDARSENEWNANPLYNLAMGYRYNHSVWRPYELEFAGANVGDPYATISAVGAGSQVLKTRDQLLAEWTAAGLTQDKKLYSTCAGGVRAALPFFIADGIFHWTSSKIDDGSSYEMGQLAHNLNKNGSYNLPTDSPWRMDTSTIMALFNYQTDPALVNAPTGVNAYATSGKMINEEDKTY